MVAEEVVTSCCWYWCWASPEVGNQLVRKKAVKRFCP